MEEKIIARNDLIISLLCFAVGIVWGIAYANGTLSEQILYILFSACMIGGIRYGWKILTFITPNIFLILPLLGWVIFFLVKFVLSLFIAPFAFVIKTISNIYILAK